MAYFSNSDAGGVLDEQCCDCPLGAGWNDPNQQDLFDVDRALKPCPVAFVQTLHNYDQMKAGNKQLREAMTLLIDDSGECQVRKVLVSARKKTNDGMSDV